DAPGRTDDVYAYVETLHDRVVEACRRACERLEPAWVRWGLGFADEAVNRRQRDEDGMVRTIGWNPSGLVDLSVPCLQAARPDRPRLRLAARALPLGARRRRAAGARRGGGARRLPTAAAAVARGGRGRARPRRGGAAGGDGAGRTRVGAARPPLPRRQPLS